MFKLSSLTFLSMSNSDIPTRGFQRRCVRCRRRTFITCSEYNSSIAEVNLVSRSAWVSSTPPTSSAPPASSQ